MCTHIVLGACSTLTTMSNTIPLERTTDPPTKKAREVIHPIFQVSTVRFYGSMASNGDHIDKNHQTNHQYDKH
ncbi:hypothetical protein Lal_00027403 [Lupinus albus]|nr:hypothetical protein Lal_00027403 [Lupinus albus]